MAEIDPHGQPFNVKFNRARRAERDLCDLCELLGLARGLLADGVVTADEAKLLHEWVARHEDAVVSVKWWKSLSASLSGT